MISILTPIWVLLVGILVLFLPGYAWLAFFWDAEQDIFERLAEAMGVSISITALMALLASLFNLTITALVVILFYLLLIPIAVWGFIRRRNLRRLEEQTDQVEDDQIIDPPDDRSTFWRPWFRYLILGSIFLFVFAWRFNQIRDVVLPLWVDSIHHVQIVNLILDNGGIPDNFEPYMPVPFFYHFAFHTVAAVFSFLGRLATPQAVLIMGQLLSVGIALAVYRLGMALWADWRRAGLAAALVALVTHMPAYYLTWGRYTLLAGLVLLPLAMAIGLDFLNKGSKPARIATFAILTTGILLTHYYAALLLAVFLVVLLAVSILSRNQAQKRTARKIWLPLVLAGLLGFLLAAPWLYRMWTFAQSAVEVGFVQPTTSAVEETYFPNYANYLWRLAGPRRNHYLLLLAVPGLLVTLLRKRTRVFGIWTLALLVFSLPWGIQLAPFRPDHAVIVLFLPTVILIADLFITVLDGDPWPKYSILKNGLVWSFLAFLIVWGIWETRSVINPSTVLVTQGDVDAINWIKDNTPENSSFFINVAHWQYGSYRGVDGGWWIQSLSGRNTNLPNALYGMGSTDFTDRVNEAAVKASRIEGCSEEFWGFVREHELTHIYLHQGRGAVHSGQFGDCPNVDLIYDKDNVFIYRIGDIID